MSYVNRGQRNNRGGYQHGNRNKYNRRGNRGRGGNRRNNRGRGRSNRYQGNRGNNNNRSARNRYHPYKNNSNAVFQQERIRNQLNFNFTQRDIERFRQRWNTYTESQTLSKLICDIPLIGLRNTALMMTNPQNKNKNISFIDKKDTNPTTNDHNTSDKKVFVDNYEVGPKLILKYAEQTSLVDTITVKKLGDLNWSLKRSQNDDATKLECIQQHVSVPADRIPVFKSPQTPFRMWSDTKKYSEPYSYPIIIPVSAVVLSAKKHNIDISKYDFISSRRSIKRILSFSEQLNTNFQCINGVIYAEDVPIDSKYFPYNYGYQFELHCTGKHVQKMDIDESEMKDNADNEMHKDKDDIIGNYLLDEMKKEQREKCVPLRKESDYYHLIEVNICDLKLLLCAEIDCVDDAGNAMELKFGNTNKLLSIWSQCFLSGITNIVQAQKSFQSLCVMITDVIPTDISCYYSSKPHKNAQLLVFYNILKDIQSKLKASSKSKEGKDGNDDNYNASDIYRLTRLADHKQATLFKVNDVKNLIMKERWESLMKK